MKKTPTNERNTMKRTTLILVALSTLVACGGEAPSPYDPNGGTLSGPLPMAALGTARSALKTSPNDSFSGTEIIQYAPVGHLGSPDSGPNYWTTTGTSVISGVGDPAIGYVVNTVAQDPTGLQCQGTLTGQSVQAASFAKGTTSSMFPQSWAIAGTAWFQNKQSGYRRGDSSNPVVAECHFGQEPFEVAKVMFDATFSDPGQTPPYSYLGVLWDHGGFSYRAIFPFSYVSGN
jgi:hypothetical protein